MNRAVCPYCDHTFYPDDFAECGDSAEWQCPECEMNFYMSWEWEPSFHTNKAPCLNGGEHEYSPIHGTKEYFIYKKRCKNCGKEIYEK